MRQALPPPVAAHAPACPLRSVCGMRRAARALATTTLSLSLLALAALVALGCDGRRASPREREERELVVFAASSLREAFIELARSFERAHPGVEISFNFGGSQDLRRQIVEGAPADVFASADERQMAELEAAARVEAPRVFARNAPVVVVAREKADVLRTFADLPNAERIVLGAPDVPIGRYALAVLDAASHTLGADFRARVEARVVSHELNVKQVLAKVALGEADAAIVYRTDAAAARGDVTVVELPAEIAVVARYPIAVAKGAPHPRLARAWVELVLAPDGQGRLEHAGFATSDGAEARP